MYACIITLRETKGHVSHNGIFEDCCTYILFSHLHMTSTLNDK